MNCHKKIGSDNEIQAVHQASMLVCKQTITQKSADSNCSGCLIPERESLKTKENKAAR
jgi:hypothetical protein